MVPTMSGHLVVCEDDDDLAQVIAANYAYAIGAGMCLIPSVPKEDAESILESFYSAHDNRAVSPTTVLTDLKHLLRARAGIIDLPTNGIITFVTRHIPWGFAFPELPTTHLFSYPNLGIGLLNGVLAEQPSQPGTRVATVIDPGGVDSREVTTALEELTDRGVLSIALRKRTATVHRVAHVIEHFPYDLLLISTHCGDADGWRWTYEFTDSQSHQRRLVVDIAIGVEVVPGQDDLRVQQYEYFVSLDGVSWNDPRKRDKVYIGTAMIDYMALRRSDSIEPVKKEDIPRVPGSMALKMADHNYLAMPQSLASSGSPIVINNACTSLHRLAATFMFAGARAYVGTLITVLDAEAQEVVQRLFGKYIDESLSVALWRAQNDVAGNGVRRPYVMIGCHFQKIRPTEGDHTRYVLDSLKAALSDWNHKLETEPQLSDQAKRTIAHTIKNLDTDIRVFGRL
jgi:hypothetical protein